MPGHPFIDVDSFAGGGGASLGIAAALGKPVDIAVNHDPEAIAMHAANHPETDHYQTSVWQVDPADVARIAPVRLAWFSPDCTFFSKAKGSAPIRTPKGRSSRDLAWVVVLWAQRARPEIIMLENVEEFAAWAPLLADGRPDPERRGLIFRRWVKALRKEGYAVEWRELRGCDFGSPTYRKRLFLIARRDGLPIVWPEPTHGPGLLPYRTAGDNIDWSIPCPSIFLSREDARKIGCKRPLAEATMRRIARGVQKFVIDNPRPFIVPVTHRGDDRVHSVDEPLRTITSAHRGEFALAAPYITPYRGTKPNGKPRVRSVEVPLHTLTTEPSAALVAAYLAQHNTGMTGHDVRKPLSTIVGKGSTQAVVAACLTRQFGGSVGQEADRPAPTTTAGGGGKTALVAAMLTNQMTSNTRGGNGDLRQPLNTILAGGQHKALVKAFLIKYYGTGGQLGDVGAPLPTLTAKARMGLVTVDEVAYEIADIGMRMFSARELYRCQGFPDSYLIDVLHQGKPLTKEAQVRMCGNSVCPQVAEALVRANVAAERGEKAA